MTKKLQEGTGEFSFAMPITKTRQNEDGTSKFVAGVASGIGMDLDGERMAETAIQAFKKAIDEGIVLPNSKWSLVPLRSGHRKEWDDVLGWVTKAEIDNEHNLWIEAELDPDSNVAQELYAKLTRPEKPGKPLQLGFSVGGSIRKASRVWDSELMRSIRVIEDVALKEISVVGQPANPTVYVEALSKSVDWEDVPPPIEELERENTMSNVSKAAEEAVVAQAEEPVTTNSESNEAVASVAASEEVGKNTTDPTDELRTQVTDLKGEVSKLANAFNSFVETHGQVVAVEAQPEKSKAETADSTSVEKSDTNLEERIASAISAALAPFKKEFETVTTEMQAVKSSVETLAAQPMDKSYSVRATKETDSAIEKFESAVKSDPHGSIIGNAVRLALGGE